MMLVGAEVSSDPPPSLTRSTFTNQLDGSHTRGASGTALQDTSMMKRESLREASGDGRKSPPVPTRSVGEVDYRANGSGRSWKWTILLLVPRPPSVCQT